MSPCTQVGVIGIGGLRLPFRSPSHEQLIHLLRVPDRNKLVEALGSLGDLECLCHATHRRAAAAMSDGRMPVPSRHAPLALVSIYVEKDACHGGASG